jgi:hypothetical protein
VTQPAAPLRAAPFRRYSNVIMPDTITVTFRDQITGRINDLLMDEDKACAQSQNLLGYLAGALLNYKDEGVTFAPALIMCDSIEEFLKTLPGSIYYKIGQAELEADPGAQILKECAPLSSENWYIYVERLDQGKVDYGVFTYFRLPTAIPLSEAITINPERFTLLLEKVSNNAIELRGARGSHLVLIFSTHREASNNEPTVARFADHCCRGLQACTTTDQFRAYLARLLNRSLTQSHGTILACGNDLTLSALNELKDAVPVAPAIDFHSAFEEFQSSGPAGSAGSILTLQRSEELLQGFLRCDGIVLFDSLGRVTAYRVFFRSSEQGASTGNAVVGGARRRAFEGLRSLLGDRLTSVLFRSQDGLTLEYGVKHEQ